MANIDIGKLLDHDAAGPKPIPKTKIICTLGPKSRDVPMLEKLLRAGMSVARFNFSHGSYEYHQETLENLGRNEPLDRSDEHYRDLRFAQASTNYEHQGDTNMIAMSYKKLPNDVTPGNSILCSDGTITLTVLSCLEW